MYRRALFLSAVFSLVALLSTVDAADNNTQPFSARVRVVVDGSDAITNQIESYLKRELRSLRDVVIVDKDEGRWDLEVVAVELTTKGGDKTGVALSVVILQTPVSKAMNFFLGDAWKEVAPDLMSGYVKYHAHWLRVGPPEELAAMCAKVVADFDAEYLEESRKGHRELMKLLEQDSNKVELSPETGK